MNKGLEGVIYGEKVARNGLIGLVILAALKAVAGFMTGAVVLMADAISSAADIATLFGSYVGLKLSRRGAEGGFKYGYYKIETFIAFLISLSILYFGSTVLFESIGRFSSMPKVHYPLIGVGMVIVSIAFSLHYANELRIAAQKSNSISLLSNAKEKEGDIFSSFVVLAGIAASYYKLQYVESIIGIAFSLLIIKTGIESAKSSLFYLLDYWDDPKLMKKIEKTIQKNIKIVTEIKKIRLRRAGTWIFGEVYLEIPSFADPRDIRSELNRLQEKINKVDKYIKDFIIYFKIPKPEIIRIAVPVKKEEGMESEVAQTTSETKFLALFEIKKEEVKIIKHIPVNFEEQSNITKIAEILKQEKIDIMINNNLNSLFYYTLQHIHQIQLYPAFSNIKTAKDTMKLLLIDV